MKAKIFVAFLVVLLAGGSLLFGGDQKPLKGYVGQTIETAPINPLDYPFFDDIIAELGMPSTWPGIEPTLVTSEGHTNVGGNSIFESARIFYFYPLAGSRFVLLFFEDITITASNGDKIFVRVSGVFYSSIAKLIDQGIITGGTGRFEGTEGEFTGTDEGFTGYITTPGKSN